MKRSNNVIDDYTENYKDFSISDNRFVSILYKIESANNIFKKIKYIKEFKNIKKSLLKGSPDIITIREMSNFIKCAEFIYNYENNMDSRIYSSKRYSASSYGFVITKGDLILSLKANFNNMTVIIQLKKSYDDSYALSYTFKNNEWTIEDVGTVDIAVVSRCIEIITTEFVKLLDECRHYKYFEKHKYDVYGLL